MRIAQMFGVGALTITLAACAIAPDYDDPSTFDLLFRYDDLNSHLAEREQVFAELHGQLDRQNGRVAQLNSAISAARKQQEQIAENIDDSAPSEQRVARLSGEASSLQAEVEKARQRLALLEAAIPRQQAEAEKEQMEVDQLNEKIASLNKHISDLEQSIDEAIELDRELSERRNS